MYTQGINRKKVIQPIIRNQPSNVNRSALQQREADNERLRPKLNAVINEITKIESQSTINGVPVNNTLTSPKVTTPTTGVNIGRIANYQVIRKFGAGNFGEVYQVKDIRNGSTLVLKRIPKNKVNPEDIKNEVTILQHLQGHCQLYILCYIGFFEDDIYYYILTEYLGNYLTLDVVLEKRIKIFNLPKLISNLKEGLTQIHDQNIAHSDIKPANIMIDPNTLNIKYIDFGLSCIGFNCNTDKASGSPIYMAPEILYRIIPYNLEILKKSDIWSLGMTIYEIITKKNLYIDYFNKFILPTLPVTATQPRNIEKDILSVMAYLLNSPEPMPINLLLPNYYLNNLLINMLDKNYLTRSFIR